MEDHLKKILVVDDEPDVVYRIKSYLERRFPLEVQVATNGNMALDFMAEHHYDAVVTDVSMPGMNGLDLTAEIIKKYPSTLVIIITGSGDYETLARSRGARFLTKPVSLDEVRQLIFLHFGMTAR